MRTSSRRDDEGGAIAIIAALTVTFLLIPVAAMAADLGAVYVRKGALQQVADVAARAGADELARSQRDDLPTAVPAIEAARRTAVQALCAGIDAGGGTWADVCTDTTWAADGDTANGEVSFYTGPPDTDGRFATDSAVGSTPPSDWITGIRVVTPPLRVEFGLAAAFSADHTDLQAASTAGIFTVLPKYGFFPMYLAAGEYGGFCTRSAPQRTWQNTHPSGRCDPAVARGNLTAVRTDPAQNVAATAWNAAVGFDRDHLPLPVSGSATFAPQRWTTTSLVRELSPGLFGGSGAYGAPPRLKNGTCRGGYTANSTSTQTGLESAYLTNFINASVGTREQFRTLVRNGTTPSGSQQGWLSSDVLRCGRLASIPVLTNVPNPLPVDGLTDGALTYPVLGLRLVWLDDRLWEGEPSAERVAWGPCLERGFYWADPSYSATCRTDLRAYTGYVLDPRLLPAIVGGKDATNALDRFIGSGMPATVRLLRDVDDPPAR